MSDVSETKILVQCIARNYPQSKVLISELKKEFKKEVGKDLTSVSVKFGFRTISDMFKSWQDFTVSGNGPSLTVEVKKSDLTQHIKQSGSRNKIQGWLEPRDNRESLRGNLLSSTYSDKNSSSCSTNLKLIKSINRTILGCVDLIEIQNTSQPFTVMLLEAINPHRFWFARYEEMKQLDNLMVRMNKFYQENCYLSINHKDFQRGLVVAASYSNLWYRGMIVKIISCELVRIFYVDFGTVEDVNVSTKIRYLTEEFMTLPAVAQRGVLSYVDKLKHVWDEDGIDFFKKALDKTKFEVKILKKNSRDSSYFLAIKTRDKQLLSNMMIERGYCEYDANIMEKAVVSNNEIEFSDYESGYHLENPSEDEESLLPTVAVQKSFSSLQNQSCKKPFLEAIERVSRNMTAHSSPKTRLNFKTPSEPMKVETLEKSLGKLEVGSTKKIYIHTMNSSGLFYFFLKEEFSEIRTFLKKFNASCAKKTASNGNFMVGSDVVTLADDNFCRGQITEETKPSEDFKIFLVDFGVTVERSKNDIWLLSDDWKKRKPAVYLGKLADIPDIDQSQIYDNIQTKFIQVKFLKFDQNIAEIVLVNL